MQQTLPKRPVPFSLRAGTVVLLGGAFLALLFLPPPEAPLTGWGAFLGRFHPLIVHFPIVLVMVPLFLEAAARLTGRHAFLQVVPLFWGLAALSSMAAVGAGYLLYASGDYTGELVRSHLWGGVGLVILTLLAGLAAAGPIRSSRIHYRAYLVLLVLTNGFLIYTSHLGGSITHGEDFLTEAFPGLPSWSSEAVAAAAKPPEELLVFQDLLMPALEARCQSCHNPHKAKGKLVMTSFEALRRGGESGKPVFVPGHAEDSEFYRRLLLPPGDDDRMPPEGKPSLHEDEIAILRWWIDAGADPAMQLGAGPADPALHARIHSYLPRLIRAQRQRARDRRERAALLAELQQVTARLGLVVEPDPDADSTLFALSMRFPPEPVDDAALAALLPYADAFSKLSLVASDITDDGLYHIGKMQNLRALYLQKSRLDGSGLAYLQALPGLEVLNLSYTRLNDAGALHLLKMPSLKQVYLYQTEVEGNVIEALRAHLEETEVLQVEGPYY